jgi:hypothetical protein
MLREQEDPEDFTELSEQQKSEIKKDRYRMEKILMEDGVKRVPPGSGKFLCPYHNDKNPSAEVKELPSGYYFICYACDLHLDYFALQAFRNNTSLRAAFKQEVSSIEQTMTYLSAAAPSQVPVGPSTIEGLVQQYLSRHPNFALGSIHKYDDPSTGGCSFATVRFDVPGEGKRVLQATFTSAKGWDFESLPNNRPLYNLGRVTTAQNVLVVEGEKCVEHFTRVNMPDWAATTSPGGGKAPDLTDWTPLTDKDVTIWRDYDRPGKRYQTEVIELIRKFARSIKVVDVTRIGGWEPEEKDDIADFLAKVNGDPMPRLESIFRQAIPWTPSLEFQEHLYDIHDGNYRLVELPGMPVLTKLTQMTLPGKSTLLIGNPGSAKSFIAMYAGWCLNEAGDRCATLFLEDGKIDYQKRCVAQMAGRSEYTDAIWQREHCDEAQEIFMSVRDRLDAYFEHVTTLEAKMMTPKAVLQWLEKIAASGYSVAIIDPVTAMEMANKQWESDQKFVLTAQSIINDAGMSLIATTHQKPGVKKPGTEGAAGGQAWHRFTHTNIWLQHSEELNPGFTRVLKADDSQDVVQHRRSIAITKARNGAGTCRTVAIDLDPVTLRIVEHGLVLGPVERQPGVVNEEDPQF